METEGDLRRRDALVDEPRRGGRRKRPGVPDLGERISSFMGDYSLSELSARSGISESYLSRIVAGHVTNPTIDFVMRISGALGVMVSELIGEVNPGSQNVDRNSLRLKDALHQIDQAGDIIRNVIYQKDGPQN